MLKKIGKFLLAALAVIVIMTILFPSEPEKPVAKETAAATLTGINEQVFNEKVQSGINEFNSTDNGFTLTYAATVTGANAVVDIVMSDISIWSYSDETSRKEFINIIGNTMDKIAVQSAYSSGDMVGVNTRLYSSSGLKLAERTLFGSVKLY